MGPLARAPFARADAPPGLGAGAALEDIVAAVKPSALIGKLGLSALKALATVLPPALSAPLALASKLLSELGSMLLSSDDIFSTALGVTGTLTFALVLMIAQ